MTSPMSGVVDRVRRYAVTVLTVGMLLGASVALAACGSSDSSSSSGSTESTTTETETTTANETGGESAAAASVAELQKPVEKFPPPGPAIEGASLNGNEIWFVPISSAIPIIPPQEGGIVEGAKALDMTVHVCDGNFVPATESACIKQAVNAGAAGIITDAIDPATVGTATSYAKSHHVPIAALSEVGTNSESLQFVPSADVANAPVAADWIVADSGGDASVIAAEVSGDKGTTAAAEAFAAQMEKECTECELNTITQSPAAATKFTSAISTALLQHPDTNYVFAQFDAVAPPVARGIQQSGNNIGLVSTTATLANVEQVANGSQAAEVGVNPNYYGWAAVDRLARMMLKQAEPTSEWMPVRIFDSTNADSLELTPTAAASGVWWGPLTYQKEFSTLWRVE
jgi:ribose transport system substrate-binding protein